MKLVKLNKSYGPEPNIAYPKIDAVSNDLVISFPLNYFEYSNFRAGDQGQITFVDWHFYRVGAPNDEGYELDNRSNPTRWNKKEYLVEFHSFYEVVGSDWKETILQSPGVILSPREDLDKNRLKHYIFFMKDATLEVIAMNYREVVPC